MKAKILRPTFVMGEPVKAGDVVDLSGADFNLLKSQGMAETAPVEKPKPEPKAKAPAKSKAQSKK